MSISNMKPQCKLYKAVMGRKRNLCTKGDDVIYVGEEEVSLFIMTL